MTTSSGDSIAASSGFVGFTTYDGSGFSVSTITGVLIQSPINSLTLSSQFLIVLQGSQVLFQSYTVATLPSGQEGGMAYATDGLKVGEVTGSGTGVPVYFSNGNWRVYSTDMPVSN